MTHEEIEKQGKRQKYLEWLESWAFKTPKAIVALQISHDKWLYSLNKTHWSIRWLRRLTGL